MTQTQQTHRPSSWVDVVKVKRAAQCAATAPWLEQELPLTDPITDIDDVDELALQLATGKLKAEQVIRAYIKR